ncbi:MULTISPECIES: 1-acyl-sn-glycerol-3-phosphate acyltransferase [unclassified Nitratiruptor]|uniref:lysophospholipid acyltransferase family protein n=1 Tax=unclassified Nitratiruptor TaxID=2624044 RepID=UPI001914F4F9|nr:MULTISPECIES: lysophospholipid acyltransferase family protein [unclassified Nitratiruptor]BCD60414.1 1-acyl-sn-glycerol-3-phosphate acyltransferase [Nitratiruptor sp. YY08-10]BCD64097.1 1-acyl-sn-glycerol-3-phosphate acyltransferase [Nitratiruptor sp. YY08-14]
MIFAKIRGLYAAFVIVILVTLNIFTFLIFPKKQYKSIKRFYTKAILFLLGIHVITEGKPDPEAKMIIMNHSSLIDIPVIESVYPWDMVWIAKKELFDTPFFGLLLKLPDNIRLDREDRKSLIHLLKESKEKTQKKTIAIFPEGTRARGDKLLPFKPGAKIIAEKLKLKVQPIVIVCARKRFDSKTLELNPGTIKVIYMPSFYPNPNDEWFKELRVKMQETVDKEKSRLCP